MVMRDVKWSREEEKRLLRRMRETVQFVGLPKGLPPVTPDPEDEDEDDVAVIGRKSVSVVEIKRNNNRGQLPKKQKCKYCTDQATKRIIHSEGMAYIPVCDKHLGKGKEAAARCLPYGGRDMGNIDRVVAIKAITPGGREGDPSSRNLSPRENWVDKRGGMPRYMKFVRNMFLRRGFSMGHATAAAVNAIKRWARGGDHVRPQVQAAAAAALAQWEAMKAG